MEIEPSPKPNQNRWHIFRIGKEVEYLGIIKAPDKGTAIRIAIERWDIRDGWQQDRLVARREVNAEHHDLLPNFWETGTDRTHH
jgi:hypothetical protein